MAEQIGSPGELLLGQLIRRCCIDRLSRQLFLGNRECAHREAVAERMICARRKPEEGGFPA